MTFAGFDSFDFTHDGKTRTVFRGGVGPAVVMARAATGRIDEDSHRPFSVLVVRPAPYLYDARHTRRAAQLLELELVEQQWV